MSENLSIGGIVLCGGESTRMRRDKAALVVDGKPLLARIVEVVLTAVEPVVVVAAPNQSVDDLMSHLFTRSDQRDSTRIEVVRDRVPGRGPLEGLRTGLAHLAPSRSAAFVTGCDYASLTPDFVKHLAAVFAENRPDAAVCVRDGRPQPLPAVYSTGIVDRIDQLLADVDAGSHRLQAVQNVCRCARIPESALASIDGGVKSLDNINTPEEYDALIRAVESRRRR